MAIEKYKPAGTLNQRKRDRGEKQLTVWIPGTDEAKNKILVFIHGLLEEFHGREIRKPGLVLMGARVLHYVPRDPAVIKEIAEWTNKVSRYHGLIADAKRPSGIITRGRSGPNTPKGCALVEFALPNHPKYLAALEFKVNRALSRAGVPIPKKDENYPK